MSHHPDRRAALVTLLLAGCGTPPRQTRITLDIPGAERPLRALVALPRGHGTAGRRWPLLVFLHGSGERGDDLDSVKANGPPMLVDAGVDWPFVLVSPQLPAGAGWSPQRLHAMLPLLHARYATDPARTSCTGLSLGGHGAWAWAAAHPGDLAAIAPVCGHGDPALACRGRAVPVRAYHGSDDPVVPLAAQQACIAALRGCGGSADFIVYPGVGHDAWTRAYADPALPAWLLQRRLA